MSLRAHFKTLHYLLSSPDVRCSRGNYRTRGNSLNGTLRDREGRRGRGGTVREDRRKEGKGVEPIPRLPTRVWTFSGFCFSWTDSQTDSPPLSLRTLTSTVSIHYSLSSAKRSGRRQRSAPPSGPRLKSSVQEVTCQHQT